MSAKLNNFKVGEHIVLNEERFEYFHKRFLKRDIGKVAEVVHTYPKTKSGYDMTIKMEGGIPVTEKSEDFRLAKENEINRMILKGMFRKRAYGGCK